MFLRFNHVLAWTGTEGVIPHLQHDGRGGAGSSGGIRSPGAPPHPCPCNGMNAFIRGTLPTTCDTPGPQSTNQKQGSLTRTRLCWQPDLGLAASRRVRSRHLLFLSHPVYGTVSPSPKRLRQQGSTVLGEGDPWPWGINRSWSTWDQHCSPLPGTGWGVAYDSALVTGCNEGKVTVSLKL